MGGMLARCIFAGSLLTLCAAGNPVREGIEKAIRSRHANQMRIEWPDGKRDVIEIFDCWNEEHPIDSVAVEKARTIWVRNFRPCDCMVMGIIMSPTFLRYAKPELFWRTVWKAPGTAVH